MTAVMKCLFLERNKIKKRVFGVGAFFLVPFFLFIFVYLYVLIMHYRIARGLQGAGLKWRWETERGFLGCEDCKMRALE